MLFLNKALYQTPSCVVQQRSLEQKKNLWWGVIPPQKMAGIEVLIASKNRGDIYSGSLEEEGNQKKCPWVWGTQEGLNFPWISLIHRMSFTCRVSNFLKWSFHREKRGTTCTVKHLHTKCSFLNGNLSTNHPCLLCVDFQSPLWIAATTDWECLSDVVSHVHPWQTSKIRSLKCRLIQKSRGWKIYIGQHCKKGFLIWGIGSGNLSLWFPDTSWVMKSTWAGKVSPNIRNMIH